MSDIRVIRCDREGCGAVKKETNHWFKVANTRSGLAAARAEDLTSEELKVHEWKDICGVGCLTNQIERWAAPRPRAERRMSREERRKLNESKAHAGRANRRVKERR